MFGRAKVLLTIASSALAMPVVAQVSKTALDGKYVGVSVEPLRPGEIPWGHTPVLNVTRPAYRIH
jgi:hypothetical protein